MKSTRSKLLPILAFLLVWVVGGGIAFAATEARARVVAVEMSNFPNASAWLKAWDAANGRFLGGIRQNDVSVEEDGHARPVLSFREVAPGVRAVIAIQPGRAFNIHDEQGVSRYQYIYNQIASWLNSNPKGDYDIGFYSADGQQIPHTTPAKFRSVWSSYRPNTEVDKIGVRALSEGLRLAAMNTAKPAMGRAVLWITPLPEFQTVKNLSTYLKEAKDFNIHIYIWLVAPAEAAKTPEVKDLTEFARATGGELTLFSGVEVLPTLDSLWSSVNHAYLLVYRSAAVRGKSHVLAVTLRTGDGNVVKTPSFSFDFSLKPPLVTVAGIPRKLLIRPAVGSGTQSAPRQLKIRFAVNFPDKHNRHLKSAVLLVDGEPVGRCSSFPCDGLTWKLGDYTSTSLHTISVKVEDEYGLVGVSRPAEIQIVVERKAEGVHAQVAAHRSALVIAVLTISGMVLVGVLALSVLLSGKRKKQALGGGASHIWGGGWRLPSWPRRKRTLADSEGSTALAYLAPLARSDDLALPDVIPINSPESTIGSDPAQSTIVIKHPSVSPVHARLWRSGEGAFYIADRRSEAGTWVNYAPVSAEGTLLQPGDLVHIGKVGFRFRLQPEENTEVIIKAL